MLKQYIINCLLNSVVNGEFFQLMQSKPCIFNEDKTGGNYGLVEM